MFWGASHQLKTKQNYFILLLRILEFSFKVFPCIPNISFWGNHFLTLTFFGRLGSWSSSHFHRTVCLSLANSDNRRDTVSWGIFDDLTTEPKLKYITPCSAESIMVFRSYKTIMKSLEIFFYYSTDYIIGFNNTLDVWNIYIFTKYLYPKQIIYFIVYFWFANIVINLKSDKFIKIDNNIQIILSTFK